MFLEMNQMGETPEKLDVSLDLSAFLAEKQGLLTGLLDRVSKTHFLGSVHRDEDQVLLQGRLQVSLTVKCARCLDLIDQPLDVKVFLICVEKMPVTEYPEDTDFEEILARESTFYQVHDHRIDLVEIVGEQVILHLPVKPLCREDCKGLCVECGTDLNSGRCSCSEGSVDPRLAPLKALKQRLEGKASNTGEN